MATPICQKCKIEMDYLGCTEFVDAPSSGMGQFSQLGRNTGHPLAGLVVQGLVFAAKSTNYFLESAKYECPDCGATAARTRSAR